MTNVLARLGLLSCLLAALGLLASCESTVDRRTRESGLEMWAHPNDGTWTIAFAGIRGYASNVVVRFGDDREETFRRPTFQLPPDIEGPIDIWLLEYELRGETIRGPYRFRFDPHQAQLDNAKNALDMLGNEWFSWSRHGADDLIYTGFVTRYTCALERVEYGFSDEPDLELQLPPCKISALVLEDEVLRFPADTHAQVVVRITFADGEQTSVHRIANPNYHTGSTGGIELHNRALVASSPSGAKLYIDGGYECDTPCEASVPVDGKRHEFRLEKRGYESQTLSWKPKSVAEPMPSLDPMELETPSAPSPESAVEDPAATPSAESDTATSYTEAADILEPCWRMLSDDLPVRSDQRCRDAYDRSAAVVSADGGELAATLRAAAEVGRAWNDADAGLLTQPPPTERQRRQLRAAKRSSVRREQGLLTQRISALSGFAHHVLDEVKARSACDREHLHLLSALEALPVEFDKAAMKPPAMHTDLAAATEHARSALRKATTACEPAPDDAHFREYAGQMIKDAMALATAQREHSRCTPGALHEVCARPEGLALHHRSVLLAAIRASKSEG